MFRVQRVEVLEKFQKERKSSGEDRNGSGEVKVSSE
jgi:hypothetical protein